MELEPITHLEKSIAGTVAPVTHLEKVIEQYGGGGGGGAVSSVNGKTGAVVLTAADLDDSFKDALLDCIANVAWATDDGQQYYDALEAALYPIDHITAAYTQSGTVYDTDSLDSLKADLVVTAFYQSGGSKVVTTYTLSGTLTEGTSTITVSYGGKTTTFNVTVTHEIVFSFEDGKAVGTFGGYAGRQNTEARATTHDPVENKNYVFTVTDSSKYQVNAVDITSLEKHNDSRWVDGYCYPKGGKTVGWKTTDSVSTPYVWLCLKKIDGTDFTDEELANEAAAVFTYMEGT